jgi:hypothetical protein
VVSVTNEGDFNVVVAGAGPVGLALSIAIRRRAFGDSADASMDPGIGLGKAAVFGRIAGMVGRE